MAVAGARLAAIALLAVGVLSLLLVPRDVLAGYVGLDFGIYRDAAQRWLEGGGFYDARQLAGPYPIDMREILYPPVLLWVLVPFTLLPAVLWWALPLGAVAWSTWRLRPAWWSWPLLALCLVWPITLKKVLLGNPVVWAWAALAVGIVYVGPAVFVLLKPSLAPFALWGARHRRWWLWAGAFGLLCLPFGALWFDWLTALRNAQDGPGGSAGLIYSLGEVPMMLLPVVAWCARRDRPRPAGRTSGSR